MGGVETGPSVAESRQKSKALLLTQVLALRTSHLAQVLAPHTSRLAPPHSALQALFFAGGCSAIFVD